MIIVRAASARTDKLCKAVLAAFTRKKTVRCELAADSSVELTIVNVAHKKIFIARKLVTGVNIAVRNDGKIFVARAAGGNFFL